MPLATHYHVSSEAGLSSVTTLVVGTSQSILIDPPFLVPDANSVVSFIKEHSSNPLAAVFVTHHHPDHYFSASCILDEFPEAKFYAHSYVCATIGREYDEKVKYWPVVMGKENVPAEPKKPEVFPYSFFVLAGDEASPVCLLGPVQGDGIDHTLFWLPAERTIVTGDAVYARSTHVWVEEIETAALLQGWRATLQLIEALRPARIIAGHIERGWEYDAKLDLEHTRKYLDLFESKVSKPVFEEHGPKPGIQDLYDTFQSAFPACEKNLDFFLGKMSNGFGEGGEIWKENRKQPVKGKTKAMLEGFRLNARAAGK